MPVSGQMDGALVPRLSPPPWLVKRHTRSWLTAFIRNTGSKFQCEPGSPLPEYLHDLGYVVRPAGVEVYQVELPCA